MRLMQYDMRASSTISVMVAGQGGWGVASERCGGLIPMKPTLRTAPDALSACSSLAQAARCRVVEQCTLLLFC
jgi:hypothetical protein